MTKIKINCDCGASFDVNRDKEAPDNAITMGCNWCPTCMTENEPYEEWYNDTDNNDNDDPNQFMLFSITDEILKKEELIKTI